jgi:hypothetical protein
VERKLLLRRLLARIGSRCRDLFHRYYLIGESTSTIAGALHFPGGSNLNPPHT